MPCLDAVHHTGKFKGIPHPVHMGDNIIALVMMPNDDKIPSKIFAQRVNTLMDFIRSPPDRKPFHAVVLGER